MTQSPTVFISYSHDSKDHIKHVLEFAKKLSEDGIDVSVDQYETSPDDGWPQWMNRIISSVNFVLIICSKPYFDRVMGNEEPGKGLGVKWEGNIVCQHIYNKDSKNSRFIPILLDESTPEDIPMPLQGATYYRIDSDLGYENLYRRITNQPLVKKPPLGKLKLLPNYESQPKFDIVKVSLARLPSVSPVLFGRDNELESLNVLWSNPNINIITLVAWGGVGKTALVNKWLLQIGKEKYHGAKCVFGWSFFSQGTSERIKISSDQFISTALEWFGDPDPTKGLPWNKGERLAELIRQQKTILIIDGLEPLQNPPIVDTGRIKDPGLSALLRELARQNPGLVIITSRLPVDDLKDFIGISVNQIDLDNLTPNAGANYLASLGVVGTHEELTEASIEYEGHALALTLLGSYLKIVHNGDIHSRSKILRLIDEKKHGGHAKQIIESYVLWFSGKPELDILFLLSLFDEPTDSNALDLLRETPKIEGLTEMVYGLSNADWQYALENLKTSRLITITNHKQSNIIDCHPLLREFFSERLFLKKPESWREAHSRLFDFYKSMSSANPKTIDELAPHFAAIIHGCKARRGNEAFDDVYLKKIGGCFITQNLGSPSADLAIMSHFFNDPWEKPIDELNDANKALILNLVGTSLCYIGQFVETIKPMHSALSLTIKMKNWENASIQSSNISGHYLAIGDLKHAFDYAKQGITYADRTSDVFVQGVARTLLATVLHRKGHFKESEFVFNKAETLHKKDDPSLPFLYSAQGFNYCDLLLSLGKYDEVIKRASTTLKWYIHDPHIGIQSIGLDHLSIGKAWLMKAINEETNDYCQAKESLDSAVNCLRQSGAQELLVQGLLARAKLFRVTNELSKAQLDLDEAFSIITRGKMELYKADYYLEFSWFSIESQDSHNAKVSFKMAKEIIEKIGYYQLNDKITELDTQIQMN